MNPEDLKNFVIRAHRNGYASTEAEETDTGEKVIRYESGEWAYIDRYRGSRNFIGYETVLYKGGAVWGMNYYGYLIKGDKDRVYSFLREALRNADAEHPFRGPNQEKQDMKYQNQPEGDIERFTGSEKILKDNDKLYEGFYRGGSIE